MGTMCLSEKILSGLPVDLNIGQQTLLGILGALEKKGYILVEFRHDETLCHIKYDGIIYHENLRRVIESEVCLREKMRAPDLPLEKLSAIQSELAYLQKQLSDSASELNKIIVESKPTADVES